MAIVVEDGTVVAGANSYLSIADARAFTLARGVDMTSDADGLVERRLILAKDYIGTKEHKFAGTRTDTAQPLTWPRTGVPRVAADEIPEKIKDAQGFLVMAQAGAVDIIPVDEAQEPFAVKSEKVGPLETVYAVEDGEAIPGLPRVPGADDLLGFYYAGINRILYRYLGKT